MRQGESERERESKRERAKKTQINNEKGRSNRLEKIVNMKVRKK